MSFRYLKTKTGEVNGCTPSTSTSHVPLKTPTRHQQMCLGSHLLTRPFCHIAHLGSTAAPLMAISYSPLSPTPTTKACHVLPQSGPPMICISPLTSVPPSRPFTLLHGTTVNSNVLSPSSLSASTLLATTVTQRKYEPASHVLGELEKMSICLISQPAGRYLCF